MNQTYWFHSKDCELPSHHYSLFTWTSRMWTTSASHLSYTRTTHDITKAPARGRNGPKSGQVTTEQLGFSLSRGSHSLARKIKGRWIIRYGSVLDGCGYVAAQTGGSHFLHGGNGLSLQRASSSSPVNNNPDAPVSSLADVCLCPTVICVYIGASHGRTVGALNQGFYKYCGSVIMCVYCTTLI